MYIYKSIEQIETHNMEQMVKSIYMNIDLSNKSTTQI